MDKQTRLARSNREVLWSFAGVLLIAAGVVVFMLRARSYADRPLDLGPESVYSERSEVIGLARPEARVSRVPSVPAQVATDGAAPVDAAVEPVQPAPERLTVRGAVLEAGSALPLEGLRVALAAFEPSFAVGGGRRPVSVSALTDEGGAFEVEVACPPWTAGELCSLQVHDPRLTDPKSRPLLRGTVALEERIVVEVTPAEAFGGRLVTDASLDPEELGVQLYVPAGSVVRTPLFLAHCRLDDELRFRTLAHVPPQVRSLVLQFAKGTSVIALKEVERAQLTSPDGAEIRLDLRTLALRVEDEQGAAIAGAQVRAGGLSLFDPPQPAVTETDAGGKVELCLENGPVEICVGHEGFAPAVLRFRTDREEPARTVRLRRLEERDHVEGQVLAADGAPVEDAFVSAAPWTRNAEIAMAGFASCRSDERGRFALRVGTDAKIEIGAFHKQHGMTTRVPILPDGRSVVLRYEPLGGLDVTLAGEQVGATAMDGPIEYFLVDRRLDRSYPGHAWAVPLRLREVPAVDYHLLVRAASGQAYGEIAVRVPRSGTGEVRLHLEIPRWFSGRVVQASGAPLAGAAVRLAHPSWPDEVEATWGSDTTDASGAFRVFGGSLSTGELQVEARGRELGAFVVRFDRSAELVVADLEPVN